MSPALAPSGIPTWAKAGLVIGCCCMRQQSGGTPPMAPCLILPRPNPGPRLVREAPAPCQRGGGRCTQAVGISLAYVAYG